MGITVREALRLPELAQVAVVGGLDGLDRVIHAVDVMEVPDIEAYVESGELLLTTTYPISKDPEALTDLVPALAQRGLAGLAVKPTRYIDKIPDCMIKQADALKFPLLRLPEDASFSKILNPILTGILHRQSVLLQRREFVHRSLIDLVLHGEGLCALVKTLAALLNLPVAVTSSDFSLLAYSGDDGAVDEPFLALLEKIKAEAYYTAAVEPLRQSFQSGSEPDTVLLHPVQTGSEFCGYICIWEQGGQLRPLDAVAVEQAAVVLALELQKQRAIHETEVRFRDVFLRELLDGKIRSLSEAQARGNRYGWDLTLPHFVMAVGHVNEGKPDLCEFTFQERMRFEARLDAAISRATAAAGYRHAVTQMGDIYTVLLEVQDGSTKEEVVSLGNRVGGELRTTAKPELPHLAIGISRLCEDVLALPVACRQATQAMRISPQISSVNPVAHYDDLGVYRLLTLIDDVDELERFSQEQLGDILEYDRRHGTDFLATLGSVVDADGQRQKAAEALFIHYNTLRYRLQRIEEISGIQVDSWRQMLNVDLAIKAHKIVSIRKTLNPTT